MPPPLDYRGGNDSTKEKAGRHRPFNGSRSDPFFFISSFLPIASFFMLSLLIPSLLISFFISSFLPIASFFIASWARTPPATRDRQPASIIVISFFTKLSLRMVNKQGHSAMADKRYGGRATLDARMGYGLTRNGCRLP